MKILFVGNSFHKVTGSSEFFVDILRDRYEVETAHVASEGYDLDDPIFDTDADLVIVWQLEFWALGFLNRGKRVVVIPMYDGSGSRPAEHWKLFSDAVFVNFSLSLHLGIERAGATSMLLKYFPEPKGRHPKHFYNKDAFLWERRPSSGITVEKVRQLFGNQIDSLHLHMKADPGEIEKTPGAITGDYPFRLTMSRWFPDRADLGELLERSNIYIAPRPSEGIGMAFLEAMSYGSIVVAQDLPTHNEYISNWVNGILMNLSHTDVVDLSDTKKLHSMSSNVLDTISQGHAAWRNSIKELYDFLENVPAPVESIGCFDTPEFRKLSDVATRENTVYLPVLKSFYSTHPRFRSKGVASDLRVQAARPRIVEVSRGEVLNTVAGKNEAILATGWDQSDRLGTWSVDAQAEAMFMVRFQPGDERRRNRLVLRMRTTQMLQNLKTVFELHLNGESLGYLPLSDQFEDHDILLPPHVLSGGINLLKVSATQTDRLPNRTTRTAFALQQLSWRQDEAEIPDTSIKRIGSSEA